MSKRKWTDEQLIEAVKSSLSYAEVIKKLGYATSHGKNIDLLKDFFRSVIILFLFLVATKAKFVTDSNLDANVL